MPDEYKELVDQVMEQIGLPGVEPYRLKNRPFRFYGKHNGSRIYLDGTIMSVLIGEGWISLTTNVWDETRQQFIVLFALANDAGTWYIRHKGESFPGILHFPEH